MPATAPMRIIQSRLLASLVLSMVCGRGIAVSQLTHGWDCVACKDNTMLAGNFNHYIPSPFDMNNTWWIDTVAHSYAAVALGHWLDSQQYNGTGESGIVTVARALKAVNPQIKALFYQGSTSASDGQFILNQILVHPDWWLKDETGRLWTCCLLQEAYTTAPTRSSKYRPNKSRGAVLVCRSSSVLFRQSGRSGEGHRWHFC